MGNTFKICCPSSTTTDDGGGGPSSRRSRNDTMDSEWGNDSFVSALDDFKSVFSRRSLTNLFDDNDIWHDALMEHDGEMTFDVSDEELHIIKSTLQENFADDNPCPEYMSDAYLLSVASKPYSKDMSRRRPLEYTMEKLTMVMKWRKENHAPDLPYWVELAQKSTNGENPDPTNCNDQTWTDIKLMISVLNTGSTYIHGHTKDGRPIVWIRTCRKQWYPDADAEGNLLILLLDAAIRNGMPEGVTDFTIISHSYKPPPPHPKAVYKMLSGLVKGYPDRMRVLISAPVSSIVEFVMKLLLPLMPGRLAEKFVFLSMDHVTERMEELLLNGSDDIPTFFGGTNTDHDQYYPDESSCPSRGGILKFDYHGMVERLKEQRIHYEKRKRVSFATAATTTTPLLGTIQDYDFEDEILDNIDDNNNNTNTTTTDDIIHSADAAAGGGGVGEIIIQRQQKEGEGIVVGHELV